MFETENPLLVEWIPPGIQEGDYQMTSRNSKYFAYSSYLILYVMKTNDLSISFVFSVKNMIIAAICLNPVQENIIAVAFCSRDLFIIDVAKEKIMNQIVTKNVVFSMHWVKSGETLVFNTPSSNSVSIFSYKTMYSYENIYECSYPILFIDSFFINETVFMFGSKDGEITRLSIVDAALKIDNIQLGCEVVAMECDKQAKTNFIVVCKNGSIYFYDLETEIKEIHHSDACSSELGAASWLSDPPGHFVTGDFNSGILRIWSPANDAPIESFSVYPRGFHSIRLIKDSLLFCTFNDFYIAVYDLKSRKFIWSVNSGHSNTIFDIRFHPKHQEILLSSGAEGILCAWDVNTMNQIVSMKSSKGSENECILTSAVSNNCDYIALGYKSGSIGFASLKTYRVTNTFFLCKGKILCLSISEFDTSQVLAVSDQKECVLFNKETRSLERTINTRSGPRSCAFSPYEKDVFAVGCSNGEIVVFSGACSTVYKCGKGDFSEICWSPTERNIIFTLSEAGVLQKWDVTTEKTNVVLVGYHMSTSRVMCPHPTIPNIVITGSYDGYIHVYDAERMACISSFIAHSSHVYGIACSSENPFLLATSGRDSTVRLWSLQRILIDKQIKLALIGGRIPYQPLHGFRSLEQLVKRIANQNESNPSLSEHINDRASNEESKFKHGSYRKSKQLLIEGAKKEAMIGNMKAFCEIMFEVGEFDKALASAPAVSFEYWKELGERITQSVKTKTEKANYQMITGDMNGAAKTFSESNNFSSAMMCVSAQIYPVSKLTIEQRKEENKKQKNDDKVFVIDNEKGPNFAEYKIASAAAKSYFEEGKIFNAVNAFLTIGDVPQAMHSLLKNGELLTALSIDIELDLNFAPVRERFAKLAYEISKDMKVFSLLSGESIWKIACSLVHSDNEARSNMMKELGVMKPEINDSSSAYDKLKCQFIDGEFQEVANDCIQLLKGLYLKESFDFNVAQKYVEFLELVPLAQINGSLQIEARLCALYLHAYEAFWKGFRWCLKRIAAEIDEHVESLKWMKALVPKLKEMIAMCPKKGSYTISVVGKNYPYPITGSQKVASFGLKYKVDDQLITREHFLQWINLTSFGLKASLDRVYL